MKKILVVLTALLISAGLWAEPACINGEKLAENAKMFNNGSGQYRVFTGFNFKEYEPSRYGIEKIVEGEYKKIKSVDGSDKSKYVAVGHSQGGLRVLAYSTYLKKNDTTQYNRLAGVITVSGIDKGLKALDGGFTNTFNKLENDISILANGARGVCGVTIATDLIRKITESALTAIIQTNRTAIFYVLKKMNPILNYTLTAYQYPNSPNLQELKDMIPGSAFINKYVSTTEKITYKVKTGTETVWVIKYKKVLGVKIPYPAKTTRDVYKYVDTYKDKPVFDSALPVGYIVGANANTLSMMDADSINGVHTNENKIRNGFKTAKTVFNVAYGVHIAKCVGIVGLFTNSPTYAKYCKNAADWCGNLDGEINELLGSSKHDGLVAEESQFYPKTFYNNVTGRYEEVHSKVLASESAGYKRMTKFNHMNITPADRLNDDGSVATPVHSDVQKAIDEMIKKTNAKR
ncbi:MAG: hypothetical protein MJ185_07500 [Treponema sp.]|nr:hypothetical protein [Treponema sp.]